MFTETVTVEQYIAITFSNFIHDTFEPFKGALFPGNPIEVSSAWPVALEAAAYLLVMHALLLLLNPIHFRHCASVFIYEKELLVTELHYWTLCCAGDPSVY